MPEVSVVISTFDRRDMLVAALCSALAQRDVDLEVVVVDNGSTDDTAAMLAARSDPRLRVVRNETSLGSVGGRNTGLRAATGTWVGMLDDDDLWSPDKLRSQLDAASAAGRDWAYTGCVHIDDQDRILGGRPPPTPDTVVAELPRRFVLPGGMSNVIWRRGMLDPDGLDPELPFPADWDVALRLRSQGPPAGVIRPLIAYRQHGSNMSRDAARHLRQLARFEQKHAEVIGAGGIDWGAQHRFVAAEELRAGARGSALRSYARAVAAGDLRSLPRAAGALMPASAQRWLQTRTLSDPAWLAEAWAWLRARDRTPR